MPVPKTNPATESLRRVFLILIITVLLVAAAFVAIGIDWDGDGKTLFSEQEEASTEVVGEPIVLPDSINTMLQAMAEQYKTNINDTSVSFAYAKEMHKHLGFYDAEIYYNNILMAHPKRADVWAIMARGYAENNDPKKAENYGKEAYKLNPKDEELVLIIAQAQIVRQKKAEAEKTLEKLIKNSKNKVLLAKAQELLNSLKN